jgi:hypothetical protein
LWPRIALGAFQRVSASGNDNNEQPGSDNCNSVHDGPPHSSYRRKAHYRANLTIETQPYHMGCQPRRIDTAG